VESLEGETEKDFCLERSFRGNVVHLPIEGQ
jgi:hypothetical protein